MDEILITVRCPFCNEGENRCICTNDDSESVSETAFYLSSLNKTCL